jgi:hypothetical protein
MTTKTDDDKDNRHELALRPLSPQWETRRERNKNPVKKTNAERCCCRHYGRWASTRNGRATIVPEEVLRPKGAGLPIAREMV